MSDWVRKWVKEWLCELVYWWVSEKVSECASDHWLTVRVSDRARPGLALSLTLAANQSITCTLIHALTWPLTHSLTYVIIHLTDFIQSLKMNPSCPDPLYRTRSAPCPLYSSPSGDLIITSIQCIYLNIVPELCKYLKCIWFCPEGMIIMKRRNATKNRKVVEKSWNQSEDIGQ